MSAQHESMSMCITCGQHTKKTVANIISQTANYEKLTRPLVKGLACKTKLHWTVYDLFLTINLFIFTITNSTFRQECTAHIALKIGSDGQSFRVRSLSSEHNHEISLVKTCLCKIFTLLSCSPIPSPKSFSSIYQIRESCRLRQRQKQAVCCKWMLTRRWFKHNCLRRQERWSYSRIWPILLLRHSQKCWCCCS